VGRHVVRPRAADAADFNDNAVRFVTFDIFADSNTTDAHRTLVQRGRPDQAPAARHAAKPVAGRVRRHHRRQRHLIQACRVADFAKVSD